MTLKEFLNLYDNWNGITVLNDDHLEMVEKGKTVKIAENSKFLEFNVVSFGFYDNELCVRIRDPQIEYPLDMRYL